MFKSILLFVKSHTIATIITTTVVVGTAVVTPIVVENYQLDKNVKENLDMLVSSDYKEPSDNNETENNIILNENEQSSENKSVNTNEHLTFRIEKVYHKTEGGNVVKDMQGNDAIEMSSEGIEYKIVPSYDKDYSKWTKEEKEAYLKAYEETVEMVKNAYKDSVAKDEQAIKDIEKEIQLEVNSWSKYYSCGTSSIAYNSYTKKYKGHISKGGKWNEQGFYVEKDGRDIDISREEFRSSVYYELMQNIKNDEDSLQSDKDNYLSQLNELYHLSD